MSMNFFFKYPHKPGYVRWPLDNWTDCVYIEEKELKRLLAEELEPSKYTKVISCE